MWVRCRTGRAWVRRRLVSAGRRPLLADHGEALGGEAVLVSLGYADPGTRLVFTTREPLPTPFARRDHEWELGALHPDDAIELVGQVMTQHGWTPPRTDTDTDTTPRRSPRWSRPYTAIRALVLLARETAERGVRACGCREPCHGH
jgi:hypothetical protein